MEMFGPYRIEAELGRGGMGEVHRAFDTRRERTVALKRLAPGLAADDEYRERFRRESRLAARLSSPHVIPIHDFGEIDDRLYIDMRLVPGRDLGAMVTAAGPVEPGRALGIARHVADALDSAHAAGMVHRDVKPSNVLVSTESGADFAYLLDFGIVRAVGDGSQSSLTSTGAAIGTLAYMAPEVFTEGRVDHRVDVYALSCVLFEILTARRPFDADGPGLMYQHLHAPPPRLSDRRPDLPPALTDVLARGMAKNPADRPPSAGDLVFEAGRALASAPGATRPIDHGAPTAGPGGVAAAPTPDPTPDTPPRRRVGRRAVVAIGVVALLGGAVAAVLGVRAASSEPDTTTLRLAFPDIAKLGPACRQDDDPAETTTAGQTPVAVIRCGAASGTEWTFLQWATPSQAGLYVEDLRATRTNLTRERYWTLGGTARQGTFAKLADGPGALITGGYTDRPFTYALRAADLPTADRVFRESALVAVDQVPR